MNLSNADAGLALVDARTFACTEYAARDQRLLLIVSLPAQVSRFALFEALRPHVGRWGRRAGDESALIDLSNHPSVPAQTIYSDGSVRDWPDLAEGLATSIARANILIVFGLEQMLQDTPHRLAAFLEARARHQILVVLSSQAHRVAALNVKGTPVYVDRSTAHSPDLRDAATRVALLAIDSARKAFRRTPGERGAAQRRSE